jgi:NADH dehydrogenase
MSASRKRVVVIGAGFGGLRAARSLRGADVDVILIDRCNYHLFQPLLYQVATAGLGPDQIAYPVRTIFRRQRNVTFRMAVVTGIDLDRRAVLTSVGDVPYDFLIFAAGAETNFFGMDDVRRHALGLKGIGDALVIRNHVLRRFEEAVLEGEAAVRRALLTFVVAGGGPTGVEMAGALSELIRLVLRKDYPHLDLADVRVLLLEAGQRILPVMPFDLCSAAVASLAAKNVEVRAGTIVQGFDGERVTLKGGETIDSRTLIWAAGVRVVDLAKVFGVPLAAHGRVPVEPTLQLRGRPEVFVIGDAAFLPGGGEPPPMMAPVAIQMGTAAAVNIRRTLGGEEPLVFRYKDPGSLATIGRNSAVAFIGGRKFRGLPAWIVWLVVHLIQLIGFRNRLIVLINWAWDYFLYERAVRIITGR